MYTYLTASVIIIFFKVCVIVTKQKVVIHLIQSYSIKVLILPFKLHTKVTSQQLLLFIYYLTQFERLPELSFLSMATAAA